MPFTGEQNFFHSPSIQKFLVSQPVMSGHQIKAPPKAFKLLTVCSSNITKDFLMFLLIRKYLILGTIKVHMTFSKDSIKVRNSDCNPGSIHLFPSGSINDTSGSPHICHMHCFRHVLYPSLDHPLLGLYSNNAAACELEEAL